MACHCKRQVRKCHVQWFFYRLKMFKRCSGWQQVWSAAHLLRQPPRNAPRRSGRIPQWFRFDTLFKMSFFLSLSIHIASFDVVSVLRDRVSVQGCHCRGIGDRGPDVWNTNETFNESTNVGKIFQSDRFKRNFNWKAEEEKGKLLTTTNLFYDCCWPKVAAIKCVIQSTPYGRNVCGCLRSKIISDSPLKPPLLN